MCCCYLTMAAHNSGMELHTYSNIPHLLHSSALVSCYGTTGGAILGIPIDSWNPHGAIASNNEIWRSGTKLCFRRIQRVLWCSWFRKPSEASLQGFGEKTLHIACLALRRQDIKTWLPLFLPKIGSDVLRSSGGLRRHSEHWGEIPSSQTPSGHDWNIVWT